MMETKKYYKGEVLSKRKIIFGKKSLKDNRTKRLRSCDKKGYWIQALPRQKEVWKQTRKKLDE